MHTDTFLFVIITYKMTEWNLCLSILSFESWKTHTHALFLLVIIDFHVKMWGFPRIVTWSWHDFCSIFTFSIIRTENPRIWDTSQWNFVWLFIDKSFGFGFLMNNVWTFKFIPGTRKRDNGRKCKEWELTVYGDEMWLPIWDLIRVLSLNERNLSGNLLGIGAIWRRCDRIGW